MLLLYSSFKFFLVFLYYNLYLINYNTYIKTDYKMKVIEKAYSFKNGWKYKLNDNP